jgi:DNA-binding response OmpR family regulator
VDESITLTPPAAERLPGAPRVLVVVRDARLRASVDAALRAHGLQVVDCGSVEHVAAGATGGPGEVVLLDWSKTEGLLTNERRAEMRQLCRQMPILLLVPERWLRLITAEELGVTKLLPKASGMVSLVETLVSLAGVQTSR